MRIGSKGFRLSLLFAIMSLLLLLAAACGASATATPETTPTLPAEATSTLSPGETPSPTSDDQPAGTPTAQATPASTQPVTSGQTSIIMVDGEEPASLGALDPGCQGSPEVAPCADYATDPFTYISGTDFEVVPLSGVERWEEIDPQRWRFHLRDGVAFHNGEPWNADAAKLGIDLIGTAANALLGYQYTGDVSAEVVDDLTVDVVCNEACPIYPRQAFHTRFQAPQWFQSASDDERNSMTNGFGPYRLAEWQRGEYVRMEAYENYLPNPNTPESQAPVIQDVTIFHRGEPTVRAAMVQTGEADFAFDIGLQNRDQVPASKTGGTSEVFVMYVDTIWHPELKKKEVRQALAHAINCPEIVDTLYDGITDCIGNVATLGTVGITPENSQPYEYDPELSMQLLEEAEYDQANEIIIYVRAGRFYLNTEVAEATQSYWEQVGVNASVQVVETAQWREISRSGPGQYSDNPLDAPNQPPPPPIGASAHVFQNFPSDEALDFQKAALGTLSCYATSSHVCQPDTIEPLIQPAVAASGEERQRLMEELADIVHEDVLFIPYFEATMVYGLNQNLNFEPRYDRRVRLNTMSFSE